MNIISVAEIKANARIEESYEDSFITSIGNVAEDSVLNLIGRSYEDILEEYGTVPTPIKHACVMMATHLYENRSVISMNNQQVVPYTLEALIKPYIRF